LFSTQSRSILRNMDWEFGYYSAAP
jgi:hypothetical protein